jgi:hypothetical protein
MKAREITIKGDVAYVPLTKGYVAIIDSDDVHLVDRFNWHAHVKTHTVYAEMKERRKGKRKAIGLHTVIMGGEKSIAVDHIDGCGLNNRRSNLRFATKAENAQNSRLYKTNTSGYKGVIWCKDKAKWRAQIMFNQKNYFLGHFLDPKEAHKKYIEASNKLHGAFGRVA